MVQPGDFVHIHTLHPSRKDGPMYGHVRRVTKYNSIVIDRTDKEQNPKYCLSSGSAIHLQPVNHLIQVVDFALEGTYTVLVSATDKKKELLATDKPPLPQKK
ncbi:MAG: hypothetical protein AAF984_10300 [Verrucomicrobiota bacterium]